MTFYELYNKLSEYFPKDLACDWDNDGVMCCDLPEREVKKVLIALDVTMDTVKYACENGYDTVISHHPLVFRAQKSLSVQNYTQNKLITLVKSGVGVMSFHTRLDAAFGGVNDTLASILNLENVSVDKEDPIGRFGYLKKETELEAFAKEIKAILNTPAVLFNGNLKVHKVYVVGGDGKDLIENAINNGCDTIVTGRASYNTIIDACDLGINIVEAGHFYTENPVCITLEAKIKELDCTIETHIFNSNTIKLI